MSTRTLVSAGEACQVAHQMRRRNLDQLTGFFDWIVTPQEPFLRHVDLVFDRILEMEDLDLAPNGLSVLDRGTGFRFYQHDFNRLGPGQLPSREEVATVRDRYLRRAERTRALLGSGKPVVLFRHFYAGALDKLPAEAAKIANAFRSAYPGGDLRWIWLTQHDVEPTSLATGELHSVGTGRDWKGDDARWDALLDLLV